LLSLSLVAAVVGLLWPAEVCEPWLAEVCEVASPDAPLALGLDFKTASGLEGGVVASALAFCSLAVVDPPFGRACMTGATVADAEAAGGADFARDGITWLMEPLAEGPSAGRAFDLGPAGGALGYLKSDLFGSFLHSVPASLSMSPVHARCCTSIFFTFM